MWKTYTGESLFPVESHVFAKAKGIFKQVNINSLEWQPIRFSEYFKQFLEL